MQKWLCTQNEGLVLFGVFYKNYLEEPVALSWFGKRVEGKNAYVLAYYLYSKNHAKHARFCKYLKLFLSCATSTAVWQNGGFSAKFKFSSSIELLCKTQHLCFDCRHIAKPKNVMPHCKKRPV